jgi:BCD family chlorophyll transporter-like MFS transporter
MHTNRVFGLALAMAAYVIIGFGVSAAGTALLAMVAEHVEAHKLARAAAILWVMMIAGIAVTAGLVGSWLDPYSPARLLAVCGTACVVALVLGIVGAWGMEPSTRGRPVPVRRSASLGESVRLAWADVKVRRFAAFIFVSMLAYSAQDLILEPFGGAVFALTPGESTQLGGLQHGGVLAGMIIAALAARHGTSLRHWAVGGCIASGVAFALLAASPMLSSVGVLKLIVFGLGLANGAFAIGAIGTMMAMIGEHQDGRAGLQMGIFGAAQAIAYATGGFAGGIATDASRALSGSAAAAYASVFVVEAVLFVVAAGFALRSAAPVARTVNLESDERVLALMR